MNGLASSTIQKEEMPFKSSGTLPVDRGSVNVFIQSHMQTSYIVQHVAGKLTSEEVFLFLLYHCR